MGRSGDGKRNILWGWPIGHEPQAISHKLTDKQQRVRLTAHCEYLTLEKILKPSINLFQNITIAHAMLSNTLWFHQQTQKIGYLTFGVHSCGSIRNLSTSA